MLTGALEKRTRKKSELKEWILGEMVCARQISTFTRRRLLDVFRFADREDLHLVRSLIQSHAPYRS